MAIKGIDVNMCNLCYECIKECPLDNFSQAIDGVEIIFHNSQNCVLCGHCIAVCPEDAIIYEDMKDIATDLKQWVDCVSYDSMYKLLSSKRSVRQYKNKKVPKELIQKVINCMRYAPTGMNTRTLKCLVISEDHKIDDLINPIIRAVKSEEEKEIYRKKREKNIDPFFHNAPHILILYSDNDWDSKNAIIAITYAMLCAETLGLGSCWIGGVQIFLNENKEMQKNLFGIDDEIRGIMILGYPTVNYFRVPPRPLVETKFIF